MAVISGTIALITLATIIFGASGCASDPSDARKNEDINPEVNGGDEDTEVSEIPEDGDTDDESGEMLEKPTGCSFKTVGNEFEVLGDMPYVYNGKVFGMDKDRIQICDSTGCEEYEINVGEIDPESNPEAISLTSLGGNDHLIGTKGTFRVMSAGGSQIIQDPIVSVENYPCGDNPRMSMSNFTSGVSIGSTLYVSGDMQGCNGDSNAVFQLESDGSGSMQTINSPVTSIVEVGGRIAALVDDEAIVFMDSSDLTITEERDVGASVEIQKMLVVDKDSVAVADSDSVYIINEDEDDPIEVDFDDGIDDFTVIGSEIYVIKNEEISIYDIDAQTRTSACTIDGLEMSGDLTIHADGNDLYVISSRGDAQQIEINE